MSAITLIRRLAGGIACMATIVLALAAASFSASAHDYKLGSLTIDHPWARATPPAAKVGGGYVTIVNGGDKTDRLVSASADFAGKVEIHEMKMDGGTMVMRPLANGIEIPAGGTVELKPGGLHIMFMALKEPLREGESRKATLTFENAGTIEVEFAIAKVGAKQHHAGHEGMNHGEMDHGEKHEHMDHSGHGHDG